MKMQTINSKKHKEKLLRIIMSDDEKEPEFQVFMQGLKYLQENEDNELVTTIIRSIEKSKATYIPFEDEKEVMGDKHYVSFILYEREQRSCAFNYIMLISILNMFNTDVSKTIDQIYDKFQTKCNLMNIKCDVLEEQVNELSDFIKEKGLKEEYYMHKK